MSRITRRHLIRSAGALGGTGVISGISPDLVRFTSGLIFGAADRDLSGTHLVARLGAGSGPNDLGVLNRPETMADGPKAIVARRDGSLAILDTLNRRISLVRDGQVVGTQDLANAIYPIDLQESGGHLFVLDPAADQVLEVDGSSVKRHQLPRESRGRASGLSEGRVGSVSVVEEDFMSYPLEVGRTGLSAGFLDRSGQPVRVA